MTDPGNQHQHQHQLNTTEDDTTHVSRTSLDFCIITYPDGKKNMSSSSYLPENWKNTTAIARMHYAILKTITKIYPEIQVFDNNGHTLKEFVKLKSYNPYLQLQYVKANETKSCNEIYLVFHCIRSPVTLNEICWHSLISQMTQHLWNEDNVHINRNMSKLNGVNTSRLLVKALDG